MKNSHFIKPLIEIAHAAGNLIMEYYEGKIEVQIKEDDSPVTAADIAANEYIVSELKKLDKNIPIVAEESANDPAIANKPIFWLVDPIDGTKGYIKKTGEFTVNIGLIEDGEPTIGVVYVPAQGNMYFTGEDGGAYKSYKKDGEIVTEQIAAKKPEGGLIVVASKSHRTPETDEYIEKLDVKEFISAASSLKFCLLAEGKADIYPRFGPTMEWDTAAGHAVLKASGGRVENLEGEPFIYGKGEFRNTFFVAFGKVE